MNSYARSDRGTCKISCGSGDTGVRSASANPSRPTAAGTTATPPELTTINGEACGAQLQLGHTGGHCFPSAPSSQPAAQASSPPTTIPTACPMSSTTIRTWTARTIPLRYQRPPRVRSQRPKAGEPRPPSRSQRPKGARRTSTPKPTPAPEGRGVPGARRETAGLATRRNRWRPQGANPVGTESPPVREAHDAAPEGRGVLEHEVRKGGLEPPQDCSRRYLKPVRLPIPPLSRAG